MNSDPSPGPSGTAAPARHYGMDWLRIGAFGLLILYHIGMVFVPWNFHVKSTHVETWATLPMLATNAWRLTLLFVVSGYASRALLRRSPGAGGFFANRSYRLLVPLIFGIAVIVPPQPWVELVTKHGYAGGFGAFWVHDYFRFGTLGGLVLPTWNHLWFVLYLWVYTVVLSLGIAVVRMSGTSPAKTGVRSQNEYAEGQSSLASDIATGPRPSPGRNTASEGTDTSGLQGLFDRVFGGAGVVLIPTAWFVFVHAWLFLMVGETHGLFDDWIAHASYLPAFLFGFALAGSPRAMAAIVRWWRVGAVMAVLGYAFILGVEARWPGNTAAPRWIYTPYGAAHAIEQWGAIIALIGIAELYWNRDHRWRPMLTEAVFPFYIIHQTIIVVVMWWLLPAGLPGWAEFGILVIATVLGSILFYLIGRSIAPFRPLIGLRKRVRPAPGVS